MISLVLAMVWNRRAQAITLALLAMFAVAAAVAAPAFLQAADRAVAAGQVATALPDERGLVISSLQDERMGGDPNAGSGADFSDIGPVLASLPGFDYVYAAEYPTIGIEPDRQYRSRFTYRQHACGHLVMATGRCLIGEGEVVIGVQTARRLKLAAGDPVELTFATFNPDPRRPGFLPDGAPKKLTVVGTYTVPAPDEPYWGAHGYFATDPGDRPGEPIFTDRPTLDGMDHGATEVSIDGAAGHAALEAGNLGALRAGLAGLNHLAAQIGPTIAVSSKLPDLLDRIDSGRAAAKLIVPLLAAPLVLLACLSIFLAVGYGTEGRRPELAVVALRGTRLWGRWWLATGESIFAILVGAVAGCLAGPLLVDLVAAVRFPGVDAAPGLDSLRYAPLAAAAAVLAALLAQSRQLVGAVAELLRRAPAVPNSARALAVEAGVALLAVVTCVQLFVSHGSLTGLGLIAPAFLILALALLAARALLPVVTRYAVRTLGRGRLGVALAGFQLSRRPGAARLFALLVAAVAVVSYAACAVDVAVQGRAVESRLGTGAYRVVSVEQVSRQQLLAAVRAVDPGGSYAMAVAKLPGDGPDEPAGLAVDTPRLAAVANWSSDGPTPEAVARALRPAAPAPVVLPGRDVTLDVTATGVSDAKPLRLSAVLSGVTGLGDTVVQLGNLNQGRFTYQQRVPICRDGCRLNALEISTAESVTGVTGRITVHALGIVNPRRQALPAAQLADPGRWRITASGTLSAAPDGLGIELDAPAGLGGGTFIQPVDTPYPLPVASAGPVRVGTTIAGFDGRLLPAARTVKLPVVPQTGTPAAMVDLEYADRLSTDAARAVTPQVWLNDKAPADVLNLLAAKGLVVTGDISADQIRKQLDTQGPALALWFYILAGWLATALAAGALILAAAVDRTRRVEDLSALRAQGLGRGPLRQATLWTYPVLVVIAVLAGLGTALIAWALTGWALPLAGLDPPALPLPGWPRPLVIAAVGVAVLAVLALVAFYAGRRTLKEIR
jgi:putative ABC transport system permease protein